ncbi:MAG: amidohydrolase [Burkholderiaceae bacterium]|nr:amidohydrolase [Burkholderiaceae bacterium]
MSAIDRITEFHAELTAFRRDIHAHPELGFEETRTAARVADELERLGIEVHRGVGRTGVVGVLRNGSSARTIGLRADMDALPIEESNQFAHRSRHAGRMHACGHDGHTTMLLGAAKELARSRDFDGTVHLIFQPAEEGLGGARAMIDDGLFERFPCESIFGMHNRPKLALGMFNVRSGPMMAGGALFDVHIRGVGSHGARPETSIDPLMIGVQICSTLQTIVSRNVRPLDTAVLSVTRFLAGDAFNVIAQTARLSGTVRAFSAEVMALVERNMRRIVESTAQAMGGSATLEFRYEFAPTINDPEQAAFAASVCEELVGAAKVDREPPLIMASEDFSFMLEEVPGCYINIGNGDGESGCEVHNPAYDFNDAAIPLGVAFFVRAVERKLAREGAAT